MSGLVCLIRPHPHLIYFVNAIHRVHPVSLVVIETKRRGAISEGLKSLRRRFWRGSPRGHYSAFFGDAWRSLPSGVPVMRTASINASAVVRRLQQRQPDVLLDHGTSIVGSAVLRTAPLALNLHWGLSPYYRGTHCTEWALVNWDYHNIGVTIHRLTRKIDGGDVVAQQRAIISADDTVDTINMQLTARGTRLMVNVLDKLQRGESLRFHSQDVSRGFLTLNRQWSRDLRRHVRRLIAGGGLETMLRHPARREQLPIVALDQDAPAATPGVLAKAG